MRCQNCGNKLTKKDKYCSLCGTENSEYQKENESITISKIKKTKFKYIGPWLLVFCLLVGSLLLNNNVYDDETDDNYSGYFDIDKRNIEGAYLSGFNQITNIGNINNSGYSTIIDNKIYMVDNDFNICVFDENLLNYTVIYNGSCSYLQGVNGVLYFKDDNNKTFNKLDPTTNEVTTILNIDMYYIHVVDNYIYYQNDLDNESIYIYDLNTGTNDKINDEPSYFVSYNEKFMCFTITNAVVIYNLETRSIEKTIETDVFSLQIVDEYLIYADTIGVLYKYHIESEVLEVIVDDLVGHFVVSGDDIYYLDYWGNVSRTKLNNSKIEIIYDGYDATSFQLMGDYLLILIRDQYDKSWISIDINGENERSIYPNNNFKVV